MPNLPSRADLMGMPTPVPIYTAQEVRDFPDDGLRYEVIRGELFVTPSPGTLHQRAVVEFLVLLKQYVEQHRLGEAFVSPFEVEFSADTAVQPDVLVILNDRASQLTRKRLVGPPSLAIEVISYSSKRTDRLQKRALYMEEGVEEYWVVDVYHPRVERWVPGESQAELVTTKLAWQPDPSVPALQIDVRSLFEKIRR